MDTDSELLTNTLLEIILWLRTEGSMPLIAMEIVAYGRCFLSLTCIFFVILLSGGIFGVFRSFAQGSRLGWTDKKEWTPQMVISIIGVIIGFIGIWENFDLLIKSWCAPRMYVIEKLTQIVVYE